MRKWITFTLAAVAWVISVPSVAQEAEPRPQLLLKETVQGMPKGDRQEVRMFTATIKPGDKTPFHSHRFPVSVYVAEGAFTLEMEGRDPVTIKAGQAMVEPAN